MIYAEQCFIDSIQARVRQVQGRVELYEGSTHLQSFKKTDALKSIKVERTGEEGKFFGFGVGQKLIVELIDNDRSIEIYRGQIMEAVFGTGCDYIYTNPLFYITDISRDENSGMLTITAHDALYETSKHTVADLPVAAPYTIGTFAIACASFLGLPFRFEGIEDPSCWDTFYADGANFDGTETIREALNAIAEATQTIYFINHNWELVFKRLARDEEPVYEIGMENYFTLEVQEPYELEGVVSVTELGDNVGPEDEDLVLQYVRNNPFWELRDDIGTLVDEAYNAVAGTVIQQFNCSWRGNYLVEIGDKIAIDGNYRGIVTYVLNDTIEYNGGLKQTTQWHYDVNQAETHSNPSTLGDALKQTYAKVDKVNKQIELVASEVNGNKEQIASLVITTNDITSTVADNTEQISILRQNSEGLFASITEDIEDVKKQVETSITAEDVQIAINTEMAKGTDKVITSTGFTFNEEGLHISKSGREMTTTITEDGMTVYRDSTAVLTANNVGVDAVNLHATTYLIIGNTSRFEDYENGQRTGCFWIGG